jgi:hypothetical protein
MSNRAFSGREIYAYAVTKRRKAMKMILSTLVAVGVLASSASAQSFDPFNDKSLALPRSEQSGNDSYRQALPRSSSDSFRDALPLIEETFPDVVIAKP